MKQDDFLSGTSGEVSGIRATTSAVLADALEDLSRMGRLEPWRLRRAAQRWPRRRVLALAVERTDVPNVLAAAREELGALATTSPLPPRAPGTGESSRTSTICSRRMRRQLRTGC